MSAGGGYQIERALRLMCSKGETNGKVGELEKDVEHQHLVRVTLVRRQRTILI